MRFAQVAASASGHELYKQLQSGVDCIVSNSELDGVVQSALVSALDGALVASASPVPLPGVEELTSYELGPTYPIHVAIPNTSLCALSADAFASLAIPPKPKPTAAGTVLTLAQTLFKHGWKHAASPGIAIDWHPDQVESDHAEGAWGNEAVRTLLGPANSSLEVHQTWARSRIQGTTVAIDGACITDAPFTGTQQLVIEIARALAVTRPDARVVLATRQAGIDVARRHLGDVAVEVVQRRLDLECDVLYRPYQMIFADELDFVTGVGRRTLVGQLDMIGYSIASYHPAEPLWYFARNMQRYLMRHLDGVTFISDFGRQSALAECPDLESRRLHVVGCGADPKPLAGSLSPEREIDAGQSIVACLSSTFAHKNRAHAIATFAEMASGGFDGILVIGGSEPYYGRSIDEEDDLLATLTPDIRDRVHRWGHVSDDEKWWLLRHAQVVLYPSVVEGFGLVPFEAAAVGTPCLAHDSTAPGELLGGSGATLQSWAPADWAKRALDLIGDAGQCAALVRQVQKIAETTTWNESARRTWTAIDSALSQPQRVAHEDGNSLTAIAPPRLRPRSAATVRFNAARAYPAVRRRWQAFRTRGKGT